MPNPSGDANVLAWLSSRQGRAVSLLAVLIVAAWFALPTLFMAYTEGFQLQVAINAHALRLGDPGLGDSLYPFNDRFFLLTRLGTSLGLAAMQAGDLASLTAFRLIGIVGTLLLVGTLLVFLWRACRVGPALGLLCCLLFPTVFEAAYIPNDDLPSAVLVCLAVLVFWGRPTLLRTAVAGVLLGVAALLRLDAVLVAPAFAILLLTEVQGWGARAMRACIAGVLVAGIPVLAYRLCGLSFLDTFAAVTRALHLWDRPNRILLNDLRIFVLSVPAAGGLAWALGVLLFARARRWRDLGLAVIVPLLYVAAYRNQLVESRYLLPLAPFVLLTMAEGLRYGATAAVRWRGPMLAGFAVCFALWIAPLPWLVRPVGDGDGPRFVVGRAWNPVAALWWERRLNAGQAALEAGIERVATSPNPVLVTGYWNGDRLATLLLLEHGFSLQPALTPPACRSIAETLVRGQTVLLQIRTHIPFLPHQNERLTWEEAGLPCLRQARPATTQVLFLGSATTFNAPSVTLDGPGVAFSVAHDRRPPLAAGLLAVLPGLSVADVPVDAVAAALDAPVPPEERAMALDVLARRADLLR